MDGRRCVSLCSFKELNGARMSRRERGPGAPRRPWQVVGAWKTRGAYLVCSSWWVEKMGGGARWLPAGGSELDCGVGESR